MLRNRWQTMAIVVGFGVALHLSAAVETEAAPTVQRSHYRTPDTIVPDDLPPIGYRYSSLSSHEQQLLRRSFKLPMEALALADTMHDLLSAAIVQPLPNPSQPFLPVSATIDADGDPFATASNGAEQEGLGALGRLFAKEAALRGVESSTVSSPAYPPSPTASSAASQEDPFADAAAPSADPEPQAEAADPFGADESEDFDDDPFGDF